MLALWRKAFAAKKHWVRQSPENGRRVKSEVAIVGETKLSDIQHFATLH
jgi:hypothetical protein